MAARRFVLGTGPPPLDEAEVGAPCPECKGPTVLTATLDLVEKHTRRCSRRRGHDPAQGALGAEETPAPPRLVAVPDLPPEPTPVAPLPDEVELEELTGEPDTERIVTVLVSREEVVTGGHDVRQVRIARYGQWWIVEVRNRGGAIRPAARTRDEQQAKQWGNDEWTSLRNMAQGSRYWEVARTR